MVAAGADGVVVVAFVAGVDAVGAGVGAVGVGVGAVDGELPGVACELGVAEPAGVGPGVPMTAPGDEGTGV